MIWVALIAASILLFVLCQVNGSGRQKFPVRYGDLRFSTIDLDAGDIFTDDVYSYEFRFKNFTTHNVEIARTLAACSCTDTNVSPNLILPGEVGCLTGRIHFKNKSGRLKEHIIIKTIDGNQYVLTIYANVLDRYVAKPSMLDFDEVWWDDILEGTVFIDSQDQQVPSELLEIAPGHHHTIKARINKCDNNKWQLDIVAKNLESGSFHQQVRVKTNNPRQPDIYIPIRANVRAPITVKPKTLFIGTVLPEQIVPCQLMITRRPKTKTEILNISASKISVVKKKVFNFSEDTTKIEFELRFSVGVGLLEDNLAIETSSPQWITHIPIVAFVSE